MEKISRPKAKLDPQLKEYRDQKLAAMQQDPDVKKFLEDNNVGLDFLEQNSEKISDYIRVIHQCRNCTGLTNCPYEISGMVRKLSVEKDTGFASVKYVPCTYQKTKSSQEAFQDNIWINHIDAKSRLMAFSDVNLLMDNNAYILAYTRVQGSMLSGKGLFLCGQPGTGKSYLLSAMANDCARRGQSVCFVRVPLLISDLKASLTDEDYRMDVLWKLCRCDVLVLDDFGSEFISAWERDEILFPVLDERMNHNRKTYFASNLNPEELKDQYWIRKQVNGEVPALRLMERVTTLSDLVLLKGKSLRQKGSEQ